MDDDESVRDCIGSVLQAARYDVNLAVNGFDALLQLRRMHPALIISDLNMPEMSGFEFLSVVRRRFPYLAVIGPLPAETVNADRIKLTFPRPNRVD